MRKNSNFFVQIFQIQILLCSKFSGLKVFIAFKFYNDASRNSRPEVFCEKGVLRNFAQFRGKHLCESLFFNKVAGRACNFIKKETLAQVSL